MKHIVTAIALLLLPACMSLPADPSKMSADQLREWVKDRSTGVQCVIANTPWGRGVATSVNVDQVKLPSSGSVTVDGECKVTVTNDSRPVK